MQFEEDEFPDRLVLRFEPHGKVSQFLFHGYADPEGYVAQSNEVTLSTYLDFEVGFNLSALNDNGLLTRIGAFLDNNGSSRFAFQRYTDSLQCRANSASNALNKWVQINFRNDIVVHGFRHAMRDRLRAINCPSEMIDQVGGWSPRKPGEAYGIGYSLEKTHLKIKALTV